MAAPLDAQSLTLGRVSITLGQDTASAFTELRSTGFDVAGEAEDGRLVLRDDGSRNRTVAGTVWFNPRGSITRVTKAWGAEGEGSETAKRLIDVLSLMVDQEAVCTVVLADLLEPDVRRRVATFHCGQGRSVQLGVWEDSNGLEGAGVVEYIGN